MSPLKGKQFATVLVNWQKQHGRQTLPWQHTGDAYKVWLSEVMLQQTQVTTVLAYYARFLNAYPTVADLAAAPEQDVMQLWAGLGYYTRARNLHACARQVVVRFGGQFPNTVEELESLPGIGRSTAGAIASLAYGAQAPIMDGNVKRVFCRYYGVEGYPEQTAIKKELWNIATANVPENHPGVYNQALMDLGATCCVPRNPNCAVCPLMGSCEALRKGMVGLLPTPKPKKARQELHFVSLLVEDEREALLMEPQTEKGIWQGLWMVPSGLCTSQPGVAELEELIEAWVNRFSIDQFKPELMRQAKLLGQQDWLLHELTHRKMHFKVLQLKVKGVWPQCHFTHEKPVPRIVHKLIEGAVSNQHALDF